MMIEMKTCPWAAKVRRSLVAPLSDDEMEAISEHVDRCSSCRELMQSPSQLDDLCVELRAARFHRDQAMVDIAPPAAKLNEVLVDYQIESELGRGGMGVVYKAKQLKLNRTVALKVLPALLAAIRPDALKRFKREAALAASLKHSNIISVHDFGEIDGTLYYAMELVEGISLRQFIDEVRQSGGLTAALSVIEASVDASPGGSDLTECDLSGTWPRAEHSHERSRGAHSESCRYLRQVAKWMADVADALHYAHDRSVVHRDIKPANLLLSRDGRVMVSDFGLACSSLEGSLGMTRAILGTSRYMSPERLDPTLGKVNRASDVYALGATLYELLTLRPMLPGKDDRTILNQVLHYEPVPPRSIVKHLPRELETICMTAISKRPADRYATAEELANDLRRWLLDLPIYARRPSWPARAVRYVRRRKLTTGLTAALAVTVIGGGVIAGNYWQSQLREAEMREVSLHQQVKLLSGQGRDAYREGQYGEALAVVDTALSLDVEPSNSIGLEASRAWLLTKVNGREEEAVSILRGLVEEHPRAIVPLYYATIVLYNRGEKEEASRYAARLKEFAPDAGETHLVHAILEADPHRALEFIDLAEAGGGDRYLCMQLRAMRHRALNQYSAMLTETTGMVAMHPRWAQSHLFHGHALALLNRHHEAEIAFTRGIEIDNAAPTFWHLRSVSRSAQGRYSEALADASRALELDERKGMLPALARARRGLGDYQGALADCDRALQLDPDFVEAILERHEVLAAMGSWEEAFSNAKRVIDLAPDDHRGYGIAAFALINLGRHDRALPYASRYAELVPGNAHGYRDRGSIYIMLGDFDKAIADFTASIRLEPDDLYSYMQRAQSYLHERRPEAAIADLARVLELHPRHRSAHVFLAIGYWMLGLEDRALAELGRMGDETPSTIPTALLWMHLLSAEPDEHILSLLQVGAELENRRWIHMAAAYFVERATEEEFLKFSATSQERCDAYACIGTQAMFDGDMGRAREFFQRSIDSGELQSWKYMLAKEQLRRLDEAEANESHDEVLETD